MIFFYPTKDESDGQKHVEDSGIFSDNQRIFVGLHQQSGRQQSDLQYKACLGQDIYKGFPKVTKVCKVPRG